MKYDVVSQHDLIAHALGKKDSIEEPEEQQKKKPEKDIPKPKPAPPAPAKKTKPSPKSTPEPAKKPAPVPLAKKAPAPAKADPVVYDVKIDAQITAEPKKDSAPAQKKEKKAESHDLKPKEDKHAKIAPVHHEVVEMMPLAVSKKP